MSADKARGKLIGRTFDALLFVQSKRVPFSRVELARELDVSPRTALRWLDALHAKGIIEEVEYGYPWHPKLWKTIGVQS